MHAYIDVTDKGENLVGKLGLQTVPTHVLVDKSGQVRMETPPPSKHLLRIVTSSPYSSIMI